MLLRLARQEDNADTSAHQLTFLCGDDIYAEHRATFLRLTSPSPDNVDISKTVALNVTS